MNSKKYLEHEAKISKMLIDYAVQNDIPNPFMLRILVDVSQAYVQRFDETLQDREQDMRIQIESEADEFFNDFMAELKACDTAGGDLWYSECINDVISKYEKES